ncbi:hypothetical protein EJ04DRAFT_583635 [Polyplosphaeria fusca]|uniref:Uncharacterized protein n=1 Tax=Polyplosphaeria fusca TaxID=682080 RepID=A0A9P4UZX8_9PLEO|nr:hypothetical protein EJ04DRAFT_583635 [Polyplosphaeria fusca]
MMAVPPYGLGFPSDTAQSACYPGKVSIPRKEVELMPLVLDSQAIFPENTRITKTSDAHFVVLQASVERGSQPLPAPASQPEQQVTIERDDHAEELSKICENLEEAKKYAANEEQRLLLSQYIESFTTGSLETYRESQRTWPKDRNSSVENSFGFVEPYRDPYRVRAEFQGVVAIQDPAETRVLNKLVDEADTFIRRLPWAGGKGNDGKGAFEKALFEPPSLTSTHALTGVRRRFKGVCGLGDRSLRVQRNFAWI